MTAAHPPWFKFEPSVIFNSPVYQAGMRDGDVARALLQLMSWGWGTGPVRAQRAQLGMILGVGETTLAHLELLGVVVADGEGNVLAALDWLIEARDEAFAYTAKQRANGQQGGRPAGKKPTGNPPVSRGQPKAKPSEKKREESPSETSSPQSTSAAAPPAGTHHEVIRYHAELWERTYRAKYDFDGKKDGRLVKECLELAGVDAAKVKAKLDLAFQDPWLREEAKCTWANIRSKWPALVPKPVATHSAGVEERTRAEIERTQRAPKFLKRAETA